MNLVRSVAKLVQNPHDLTCLYWNVLESSTISFCGANVTPRASLLLVEGKFLGRPRECFVVNDDITSMHPLSGERGKQDHPHLLQYSIHRVFPLLVRFQLTPFGCLLRHHHNVFPVHTSSRTRLFRSGGFIVPNCDVNMPLRDHVDPAKTCLEFSRQFHVCPSTP